MKAQDLLSKFEKFSETLTSPDIPDSIATAKNMLDEHNALKRRIQKAPVEFLDDEGQRILERICGSRHKSQGKLTQ